MDRFLNLSTKEKSEIFQAVSVSKGIRSDIIEKDFWVCFMLNHLFNNCKYKNAFVFKGGTSLSKAFHVIERFSEDIDIILDWRRVLPKGEEPWVERTKTKQDQYNKILNAKAAEFYFSKLAPNLNSEMEIILGKGKWIEIDENDEMIINFYYPKLFEIDYLRDKIRLEIGPLAEWLPSHKVNIQSFVFEKYPKFFNNQNIEILTIDVERTFWEKLTILHKLAHFPKTKQLPPRYARHLYDVYCMAKSDVKQQAFVHKELLEKDVIFKQKFYYSKNSHYETATLKDISLIPAKHVMNSVEEDYIAMKNMIYGEYPEFDTIISTLKDLEYEVHQLK